MVHLNYDYPAATPFDKGLVELAGNLAAFAHTGQKRWNGYDYFEFHPYIIFNRMKNLIEYDYKHLCTALLHDVVEDCSDKVGHSNIEESFPSDIADAVFALTKKRGESYLDYIKCVGNNTIALEVKIFDITHNLESFHDDPDKSESRKKLIKVKEDKYQIALLYLESIKKRGGCSCQ